MIIGFIIPFIILGVEVGYGVLLQAAGATSHQWLNFKDDEELPLCYDLD
jgi:hypothetical protein